jgi:hypothetical protein
MKFYTLQIDVKSLRFLPSYNKFKKGNHKPEIRPLVLLVLINLEVIKVLVLD